MPRSQAIAQQLTFAHVGERTVSAHGWRYSLVERHLRDHLEREADQWCEVECLARTMFARNTQRNRREVRQRLHLVFTKCLDRGLLLVITYERGSHGPAVACKLFRGEGEEELQYAAAQLERMRRRLALRADRYETAKSLIVLADAPEANGDHRESLDADDA
jgi:hypothetical protein